MFKATAPLYDERLGGTIILATEAGIRKLLDDVSPGRLRLIEWSMIETVVTKVEE